MSPVRESHATNTTIFCYYCYDYYKIFSLRKIFQFNNIQKPKIIKRYSHSHKHIPGVQDEANLDIALSSSEGVDPIMTKGVDPIVTIKIWLEFTNSTQTDSYFALSYFVMDGTDSENYDSYAVLPAATSILCIYCPG